MKSEPENIILPFGCGVVLSGDVMDVVATSQVFMRVKRLWVSREVGACFMLGDIKIGNRSKFASCGEFSLAVFDKDQLHEPGQYPDPCVGVINPNLYVGLRVRNVSAFACVFSAHMEGVVVKG